MVQPRPSARVIDPELLAQARAIGAHAPYCDEDELRGRVATLKRALDASEAMREEIDSYNGYIAAQGVFGMLQRGVLG